MSEKTSALFYVNGEFVLEEKARIAATDLAILRGLGVFESLRTYWGEPFRLDDHLARLRGSAAAVGIKMPWTDDHFREVIDKLIHLNKLPEAAIRIVVTGGESADFFHPIGKPGLIVMATRLTVPPLEHYKNGVKVATTNMERYSPQSKTINYLPGVVAMQQARSVDPEIVEVLFIDRHGYVTEGITSNIFAFIDGSLVTPGENILEGVTRQVVLELAEPLYPVEIRELPVQDIRRADEVFLTGSVKEILPVCEIDGRKVGPGSRNNRTQVLIDAFQDLKTQLSERKEQRPASS